MSDYDIQKLVQLGAQVVERARRAGADVAEAAVSEGAHLSVKVRMGEPELVEEAGSKSLGLRVMRGQQVAVTYTSDLTESGLARFVEDAVELAKLSESDAYAGPPSPELLSRAAQHPDLELFDPRVDEIDAARAIDMAKRAESAALKFDKRLTNSEGATVSRQAGASALVTSGGFQGGVRGTYASIAVHPVADDTDGKKRSGYYWSARRFADAIESPEEVGLEAARRTLAKLGSRKIDTQEAPVIFEPDSARSILGLLAGCVNGGSIWRKGSYLVEREGQLVASKLVSVIDDPLIARGPGSRPFDGEGLLSRRNTIVERGVLKSFVLDTYSAKKLGKQSTGNASRGSSGGVGPSTTNFILQPGAHSAAAILKDSDRALFVTDMMGFGFNAVTGDFSRGASGFWIEKGERAFPVSEVTISLNLDEMLKRIDRVGDDLDLQTSICSPTIRISAMTIAGK
ncbi:MAG TPA: metallopeptidase TldD-related protein [Polyangiales bacterium]|nr:metallopeptidase TldD-related protein [Polyangiales bacterium]